MSKAIIEAVIGGTIALVVSLVMLLSLSGTINQQTAAASGVTNYSLSQGGTALTTFTTANVIYGLIPLVYAVVPLLVGVGVGFAIYKSRS